MRCNRPILAMTCPMGENETDLDPVSSEVALQLNKHISVELAGILLSREDR